MQGIPSAPTTWQLAYHSDCDRLNRCTDQGGPRTIRTSIPHVVLFPPDQRGRVKPGKDQSRSPEDPWHQPARNGDGGIETLGAGNWSLSAPGPRMQWVSFCEADHEMISRSGFGRSWQVRQPVMSDPTSDMGQYDYSLLHPGFVKLVALCIVHCGISGYSTKSGQNPRGRVNHDVCLPRSMSLSLNT